jgi:MarR family transcriptional regulator, organic hydroperoxide resistance regulator
MAPDAAQRLLAAYPRIFFACHARHVRDPKTRRVLSAHQASILDHLDSVEAITLMGLAKHMGVTAATMSLGIERLVRRGYVRRERDSGDKRRLQLRLTPAGVRIREASSVLEPQRVRALLSGLATREREAALTGLELLARAADALTSRQPKHLFGLKDAPAPRPDKPRRKRNTP